MVPSLLRMSRPCTWPPLTLSLLSPAYPLVGVASSSSCGTGRLSRQSNIAALKLPEDLNRNSHLRELTSCLQLEDRHAGFSSMSSIRRVQCVCVCVSDFFRLRSCSRATPVLSQLRTSPVDVWMSACFRLTVTRLIFAKGNPHRIACGTETGKIFMLDISATQFEETVLQKHQAPVTDLAFSGDSSCLLSASKFVLFPPAHEH